MDVGDGEVWSREVVCSGSVFFAEFADKGATLVLVTVAVWVVTLIPAGAVAVVDVVKGDIGGGEAVVVTTGIVVVGVVINNGVVTITGAVVVVFPGAGIFIP